MGALAGIVCGLVAALPAVVLLRRQNATLGHGMAAVAFAFMLVQVALLVVGRLWHQELVPFGTLSVLAFLGAVVAAVVRREL